MMTWSAGGRGAQHVNDYADRLATLPEGERWAEFCRLAAAEDDDGNRHRQDEWSCLRTLQKLEAGKIFAPMLGEDVSWFDDGIGDDERVTLYARLVEVSR